MALEGILKYGKVTISDAIQVFTKDGSDILNYASNKVFNASAVGVLALLVYKNTDSYRPTKYKSINKCFSFAFNTARITMFIASVLSLTAKKSNAAPVICYSIFEMLIFALGKQFARQTEHAREIEVKDNEITRKDNTINDLRTTISGNAADETLRTGGLNLQVDNLRRRISGNANDETARAGGLNQQVDNLTTENTRLKNRISGNPGNLDDNAVDGSLNYRVHNQDQEITELRSVLTETIGKKVSAEEKFSNIHHLINRGINNMKSVVHQAVKDEMLNFLINSIFAKTIKHRFPQTIKRHHDTLIFMQSIQP